MKIYLSLAGITRTAHSMCELVLVAGLKPRSKAAIVQLLVPEFKA